MDALSELLCSLRLSGGVFLDARFTAPWCVRSHLTADDCRPILSAPAALVSYHVLTEGRMHVAVDGEPAIEASAGDIVIVPRNDPHILSSAPGLACVEGRSLVQPACNGGLARVEHGGGGASTSMFCGFLGSEDAGNPLLAALPRVLKLDVREASSRAWIEASVRFAAGEIACGRFAAAAVVARLSELLLVEAVRQYSSARPHEATGLLKGVADPHVGRALALIHRDIRAPWSAAALAREVALSRSAFVERFSALIGQPPIRYITCLRLQTARKRLREGREPIGRLAFAVGYNSQEAFSRAFKREFGVSPARLRDHPPAG